MPNMKAVRVHNYGGSEVLTYENAPRPTPGEGDVLIRVHATTVNPFDCAVHAGYMTGYFNYTLPLIPGTDVSGIIEEVGSGVIGLAKGDEVYTRAGVYRDGTYAEYVLAQAGDVVAKPKTLNFLQSAAIPHVALTAWQALYEIANLEKGQKVLIHGAAGGVGHMAVQLAKLREAKVIGTASENYDRVRRMGVDQVINYATSNFEELVRDADVVLDTIGGDTQKRSWSTLKPGGILISTVQQPSQETADGYHVRQAMVMSAPPIAKTLTEVARMADAGHIRPDVSAVLPLEKIHQAHQMLEGRHTHGKIVMQVL